MGIFLDCAGFTTRFPGGARVHEQTKSIWPPLIWSFCDHCTARATLQGDLEAAMGQFGVSPADVVEGVSVPSRSIPPPMGVNSISSGSPHILRAHMGVRRTCGEPDELKKNTHPNNVTALFIYLLIRAAVCWGSPTPCKKPTKRTTARAASKIKRTTARAASKVAR